MQQTIDLNVDIGEGFEHDTALLAFASSVNIACGWHAGDATTMRRVTDEALQRGVAIGAHPSFPDREHFGRVVMDLRPEEVYAGVQYQVGALAAIVHGRGGRLTHVKPHGALYNQAERDLNLALAVVHAVRDTNARLAVFGLAGGQLIDVARAMGLAAVEEGFADRGYTADGKLVPRTESGALLDSDAEACEQALVMIRDQRVRTRDGTWVRVRAQTLCLHRDGAHAVTFARQIRAVLAAAEISVRPSTCATQMIPEVELSD